MTLTECSSIRRIHAFHHRGVLSMNLEFHLLFPRCDKECESKTLLGWRALERRLERYSSKERYETEIKFRHKMCFNLFWFPQKYVNFSTHSQKKQLRMAQGIEQISHLDFHCLFELSEFYTFCCISLALITFIFSGMYFVHYYA